MAYNDPGATHADDWDPPVGPSFGVLEDEEKILHTMTPLDVNQLTSFGPYARQFQSLTADEVSCRYMLKNIPANADFIDDYNAQAISGLIRANDLLANKGLVLLLRFQSTSIYYAACARFKSGGDIDDACFYITGCKGTPSEEWSTRLQYPVVLASEVPYVNDWMGMRLVVTTEGDNVRLKLYLALGATVLNTLDANGEPVWTKAAEALHINGTNEPTVIQGTKVQNWGSTTPVLYGTPGFCVGHYNEIGVDNLYVDGIRVKRMPS